MNYPLHDLTSELRQRRGYQRASANEMHEKHENSVSEPGDNSCISFFSSAPTNHPRLPDAALYGVLGDIVRRHKDLTEADPAALLAQLLVGIGSLIGTGPHILADGARHHANLFAVVCGRTSKARKGTSWVRVRNVLSDLDDLWLSTRVKTGVVSGEGITQVINEDEDRRLLLLETEFGQVLQAMKREGNTVSVLLRQAWDGSRLAVLRKKDKIEVDGAHVSLIGQITIHELHKLLGRVEISNGLANRCLWVYAERDAILPEGGVEPELEAPLARLQQAITVARTRGRLERDAAARERWDTIYRALAKEKPGELGQLLCRGEAQVMRLALIYALLDEAPAIQTAHLDAALAFWNYCEASTLFIFAEHLQSPKAGRIWEALAQGPLTMTQIHKLFGNNASKGEVDAALAELGPRVEFESIASGGRLLRRRLG